MAVAGAACVLLVGLAVGVGVRSSPSARAEEPHAHGAPPASHGATYEGAKAELLARTTNAEALAAGSPESFHRQADAAGYRLDYARLSGDYASYAAAERHLAAAFAAVDRRVPSDATHTGPFLLKAQVAYTLHRSRETLVALEGPEHDARATADEALLADVLSLRGAAKLALGLYDEGLVDLREATRLAPGAGHGDRLAVALAKVGGDDEALRLLSEHPGRTARARAWLALQRAEIHLERGRREDARREIDAACAAFPGDWHAEERRAEMDAEGGEAERARATAAYESLVARTHDPEHMDALAHLLAKTSPARAEALRREAHASYMERLAALPEATYGHALEHALREVDDPTFAVTIAEKNVALRPNGEAKTRLAQAYHRAHRTAEAAATIRAVLETRWTSSETYATAAIVLGAAGDGPAAATAAAKAAARDPAARAHLAWLERRP